MQIRASSPVRRTAGGKAATAAPLSSGVASLALFVSRWAQETPDAPALITEDGTTSYRALDERAAMTAARLASLASGSEDIWALGLPRQRLIEASVAISRLGGATLPLDPSYPAERLRFMLDDARPRCLITDRSLAERFLDIRLPVVTVEALAAHSPGAIAPERATERTPFRPHPHSTAYVVYTSGSTGVPKGVMVEHAGLGNFTQSAIAAAGLTAASRVAAVASPSFDGAMLELLIAFGAGAALVIPSAPLFGGSLLAEFLSSMRATHVFGPPSALSHLAPQSAPSVETILPGGEVLPAGLVRRWAQRAVVVNVYGPTETTIAVSLNRIEGLTAGAHAPTLGRPVDGVVLLVLDDQLAQVPAGGVGEVYVSGPALARGYLHRAALTASRFVACPSRPGERMYRTGDLVRLRTDGELDFVGRIDDQVKLRGFRIELGEVKNVLESHPLVRGATVIVRENRPGDQLLVAYVAAEDRSALPSMRDWLAERLPAFMVPDRCVAIDELPLTSNGKLDPAALPWPVPVPVTPSRPRELSPSQALVHAIWCQILNRQDVGLDENFFDVGGNSLRLIQMRNELSDSHGIELPAVRLFENTTVRKLAQAIAALDSDTGSVSQHRVSSAELRDTLQ